MDLGRTGNPRPQIFLLFPFPGLKVQNHGFEQYPKPRKTSQNLTNLTKQGNMSGIGLWAGEQSHAKHQKHDFLEKLQAFLGALAVSKPACTLCRVLRPCTLFGTFTQTLTTFLSTAKARPTLWGGPAPVRGRHSRWR